MDNSLLAALEVIRRHGLQKEFIRTLIDKFPAEIDSTKILSVLDEVHVFTDGSMKTDKGGCGCIIYLPDRVIRSNKAVYGPMLSNHIEYEAIWFAVMKLKELNITGKKVLFFTDNKSMAEQLSGKAKCKGSKTSVYLINILSTLHELNIKASFNFTPRCKNIEAHRLANKARLDELIEETC